MEAIKQKPTEEQVSKQYNSLLRSGRTYLIIGGVAMAAAFTLQFTKNPDLLNKAKPIIKLAACGAILIADTKGAKIANLEEEYPNISS